MNKIALIFGVLGQDGHYLKQHLKKLGYLVHGTTHRNLEIVSSINKDGLLHQVNLYNPEEISNLIKLLQPNEIYNLAARASSSQLFDDPVATTHVNGLAVTYILESIKNFSAKSKFCQAGSSELFRGSNTEIQDETTPIIPTNAYGAAKAYAYHMTSAYRETYNLFSCNAILYNHESPLRSDQMVVRKITKSVAKIFKNGKQGSVNLMNIDGIRDWSHAQDTVTAMHLMLNAESPTNYVIGSGILHSVRDVCEVAFSYVKLNYENHVNIEYNESKERTSTILRANNLKAKRDLSWKPKISFKNLIEEMVEADLNSF